MPFFEFRCKGCGERFDLLLPIRDRDARDEKCPECGSPDIERLISAPRVGSGVPGGVGGSRGSDCGPGPFS